MYIADVYVNLPIKSIAQAYSYIIPDDKTFLDIGWRVIVPFHGRPTEGFIVNKYESESMERPLKNILSVLDDEAWFTDEIIRVASHLSFFYLCSLAEIMRLFMPGKSGAKIRCMYEAVREHSVTEIGKDTIEGQIYKFLQENGSSTKSKLKKNFEGQNVDLALEKMYRKGAIRKSDIITKKSSERFETYLQLREAIHDETIEKKFKGKPTQQKILRLFKDTETLSLKEIRRQGFSTSPVKALVEAKYLQYVRQRTWRDTSAKYTLPDSKVIKLTDVQEKIISKIRPAIEGHRFNFALLHGVTGSGKTQVYIELAKRTRQSGRQVIILVPEIALTGQVVESFKQHFSEDIVVIHSQLSISERNDSFLKFRHGQANIAIGARSALFLTPKNLGLIVMDEEQDSSYKQDESPRYHTRIVAEMLAKAYHCTLLLGSATPSLESYYQAKRGRIHLFEMMSRIGNRPMPEIHVVDMRKELKKGSKKILSAEMKRLIEKTIEQKQQMILLLNRRGFSTFVICRSCGHVLKCPHCGLPLVYHASRRLVCHHCDFHIEPPSVCPQCESSYIRYFGSGTEKLEAELKEFVPNARIVRLDRDTTQRKFSQAEILGDFRAGKYDILLGTQMVAKGHDIPNVTAAGIISADASLNLPDFRAAERCFMMITQTAGRSGRGDVSGEVLVQCYNPEHYSVQCACAQDYPSFFEQELKIRKALYFPPFCRLIKLIFMGEDERTVKVKAEKFKNAFETFFKNRTEQQIIGPAADYISRFRGKYRFNLLIKAGNFLTVLHFLRDHHLHEDADILIDVDPIAI